MIVDFVRFKATDDVELQGWLSVQPGDTAVLHVHGRSGNGYQNLFLDVLRELYNRLGLTFLTFDNRGFGDISSFRQNDGTKLAGACYEIFEESAADIQGAIDYLASIGKTKLILEGHSLGCTKAVNFVLTQASDNIETVILLAPTDMSRWAATDPNHATYLQKAKDFLAAGTPQELVGAQCWEDKAPISAQTYPSICEAGSPADIYGDRDGGPLLGQVDKPMLIPYGDEDIGIVKVDGTIDHWLESTNKIKNANTEIVVIHGAPHSYRDHESELASAIEQFLGR